MLSSPTGRRAPLPPPSLPVTSSSGRSYALLPSMPFHLNAAAASLCATSTQHPRPVVGGRMMAAQSQSAAYSGPELMPMVVYEGMVGSPSDVYVGRATPAQASYAMPWLGMSLYGPVMPYPEWVQKTIFG